VAVVVSAGLSYLLLRRQRDAVAVEVAAHLQQRQQRRAGRIDLDAAAEDAAVDAAPEGTERTGTGLETDRPRG
jgi:hypothetical protein